MVDINQKPPLAELESFRDGKYDFKHLTYPRNVDNVLTQGHYMNFYIYMHTSSNFLSSNSQKMVSLPEGIDLNAGGYSSPQARNVGTIKSRFDETVNWTDNTVEKSKDLFWKKGDTLGEAIFRMHYTKIKSAISLYITEESIAFSTDADWSSDTSLTRLDGVPGGSAMLRDAQYKAEGAGIVVNTALSSIKDILERDYAGEQSYKTMSTVLQGLKGFGALEGLGVATDFLESQAKDRNSGWFSALQGEEFLAGLAGFAVNPQYLFMFKGIGFRKFAFKFVFTPNNEEEAADVRNIVKMFRFHAAPELAGVTGRFLTAPSVFDIEFKYGKDENKNIPKIGTCVLTHVTVDYSPRGWATHTDGMPIHTIMELRFKEVELITKGKIEDGY